MQWPVGIGAKGNEGVANMTTQTDGAIGYVEYAYAKQNKMAYTLLINKAGRRGGAERRLVPGGGGQRRLGACADAYYLILTDQAGAKSWPITGASFILVYSSPPTRRPIAEALKFFDWAYKDGGTMAAELDYVPLPAPLISRSRRPGGTEISVGGRPVWNGQ